MPFPERDAVAPERDGVTVYTGQATPATTGGVTAYAPDGRPLYFNETYDNYFDVDPVPGTRATVEYVATETVSADECGATTPCVLNVIERVNLSTTDVTRLYTYKYPKYVTLEGDKFEPKTHDFDRVNETHIAVADIYRDNVHIINTTSGIRTWLWDAQSSYSVEEGGPFPRDWTHVNDVEVLSDGRLMVGLRNFDRVVFLNRSDGVRREWTLGEEDNYTVLYEQHNPDYISRSSGGPAVIVADSENNRIIEYQRRGGEWEQSWAWADERLQWPRDADRLPNGHTLITDTHGGRIIEINERGEIVWQVEAGTPYEAERLSTGDESDGGESAARVGLESRGDTSPATAEPQGETVTKVRNVLAFVLPDFFTAKLLAASVVLAGSMLSLIGVEAYWRGIRVSVRSPVTVSRTE